MDELVKTIPKPPAEDYILSSFQQLQVKEAVDAGSFHVASMNDCLIKGQSLPPLIVLYPNIVLEGDLCIIFGQSGYRQDHLCHAGGKGNCCQRETSALC